MASVLLLAGVVDARADDDLVGSAARLEAAYPAGSISTRASAESALAAAAQTDQETERRYDTERAECLHRFLVNRCLDGARRRLVVAQRVILRVQVEAHDWQRADDAAGRQQRRAGEGADRERDAAAQASKEREARAAADDRAGDAARRQADSRRQEAEQPANRARFAQRQENHAADQARAGSAQAAATRADNVQKLAEKRDLAAQHAQQVAADRKVNEARREERRKSLAADEQRRTHPPPQDD